MQLMPIKTPVLNVWDRKLTVGAGQMLLPEEGECGGRMDQLFAKSGDLQVPSSNAAYSEQCEQCIVICVLMPDR